MDLKPVQHPIIMSFATREFLFQLFLLGGCVAIFRLLGLDFQLSILLLLALGFGLVALNVVSAAISTNIHLAEIRDLLLKEFDERKKGST